MFGRTANCRPCGCSYPWHWLSDSHAPPFAIHGSGAGGAPLGCPVCWRHSPGPAWSLGRHRYRTGFIARRSAEDLAAFRLLRQAVRDAALEKSGTRRGRPHRADRPSEGLIASIGDFARRQLGSLCRPGHRMGLKQDANPRVSFAAADLSTRT